MGLRLSSVTTVTNRKTEKSEKTELFWDMKRHFSNSSLCCQQLNYLTIQDHYINSRKWLFVKEPSNFVSMMNIWAKSVILPFLDPQPIFTLYVHGFVAWEAIQPVASLIVKVYSSVTLFRRPWKREYFKTFMESGIKIFWCKNFLKCMYSLF